MRRCRARACHGVTAFCRLASCQREASPRAQDEALKGYKLGRARFALRSPKREEVVQPASPLIFLFIPLSRCLSCIAFPLLRKSLGAALDRNCVCM